jgi:tetratricopeptide (TPR) repeat protein
VDLALAGDALGAEYILTGTILLQAKLSIVTVELCRAHGGEVIWAGRFTPTVDQLMHMCSTLASQIVGALEPRIQLSEAKQVANVPTEQLDAWAAYHRGLWHMYRFNARDNALAGEHFAHAVRLDPAFARAHAGLSFTHFQNAFLGFASDTEGERRHARVSAAKSMDLDPFDPFVNLTMGRCEWLDGNLEACLPWIERSVSLSPNYAFAIYNGALVGTLLGDAHHNEERVKRAISLSPIDPLNYAMLATRALIHAVRGNYAEAAHWAARAIASPNAHVQIYAIAAITHELAGLHELAAGYSAHIHRTYPTYKGTDFLGSFPFRNSTTLGDFQCTLRQLGF